MKKILTIALAAFAFNVLAAAPAAKATAGDSKAADKSAKPKKDDKAAPAAADAGTAAPAK